MGSDVKNFGGGQVEESFFGGISAKEDLGLWEEVLDGLSFQASARERCPALPREVVPLLGEEAFEGR